MARFIFRNRCYFVTGLTSGFQVSMLSLSVTSGFVHHPSMVRWMNHWLLTMTCCPPEPTAVDMPLNTSCKGIVVGKGGQMTLVCHWEVPYQQKHPSPTLHLADAPKRIWEPWTDTGLDRQEGRAASFQKINFFYLCSALLKRYTLDISV